MRNVRRHELARHGTERSKERGGERKKMASGVSLKTLLS